MADKGMSRRELFGMFRKSVERASTPVPDPPQEPEQPTRPWHLPSPLRPPGAGLELTIADSCLRCGACVEVCPRQCIKPLPEEYGAWAGTPYIIPKEAPCVLCDGLQCTQVCPSGTLRPLKANHEVQMGRAWVNPGLCLTWQGQACSVCHDHCPIPGAIVLDHEKRPNVQSPCTGCGLCEHYCPTEPRAVRVQPREMDV